MGKFVLLTIVLITSLVGGAQSNERDSLKALLQQKQHDTLRVTWLHDLAYTYLESSPDTMHLFASEALNLARKIGFAKGEARALMLQGHAYRNFGNTAKATELFFQALRLSEKNSLLAELQRSYNSLGLIYSRQKGEERQALKYYAKARALAEQRDDNQLPIILGNLSETYLFLTMYDSAQLYMQQAINLATKQGRPRVIGATLSGMGIIHQALKQYPLALEYFRLSLPYTLKGEDYLHLPETFMGMAEVYRKLNQPDSALFYARKALSVAEEKKFVLNVPAASEFLYQFYKSNGRADSALYYHELTQAAKDSLYSQEKTRQIQALAMVEQQRVMEKEAVERKAADERKHNLQYAAIALTLVTFFIVFLAFSHSVIANQKLIKFLGIVSLLIVFEFLNLLLHPYLGAITHHAPVFMLLAMVCIAAMLVPLHHKMEHWVIHRLVEKNNKIRLIAAKKTIAILEGKASEAPLEKSKNAQ